MGVCLFLAMMTGRSGYTGICSNEEDIPKGKGHADFSAWPLFNAGNDLRSHTLSRAVPSALRGLTSVFGMGTGGTPAVRSPTTCSSVVGRWPLTKDLAAN